MAGDLFYVMEIYTFDMFSLRPAGQFDLALTFSEVVIKGFLIVGLGLIICILIAEALRESKREMQHATRGNDFACNSSNVVFGIGINYRK